MHTVINQLNVKNIAIFLYTYLVHHYVGVDQNVVLCPSMEIALEVKLALES